MGTLVAGPKATPWSGLLQSSGLHGTEEVEHRRYLQCMNFLSLDFDITTEDSGCSLRWWASSTVKAAHYMGS